MDKSNQRNLKKQIIAVSVLGILITAILFIISAVAYQSLNRTQEQEAKQYLSEIVIQYKNAITLEINGNFQTLNALATFIDEGDSFDFPQMLSRLEAESSRNSFIRMGFVNTDKKGFFIDTDGTKNYDYDVSDETFISVALQGKNAVSDTMKDKFSDAFVNCYAVPVYQNGKIIGALTATADSRDFSKIIEQELFNGNAYVHIIRNNGDFVIRSDHAVIRKKMHNIFDDGSISEDVKANILSSARTGKSSFSTFSYKDQSYWATIIPIEINEWNLFCLVPQTYLSNNFNTLMTIFLIILFCIIILFFILLTCIYRIIKRNQENMMRLAYTDILTGLDNRNKFIFEMTRLIMDLPDYAMVLLNINGFKFVNEFYGYHTGDMLLKHIAFVLRSNISEKELCYRDSADRFGILIRYRENAELTDRLLKIQEQIRDFKLSENQSYHILCNFGVEVVQKPLSKAGTDFDNVMNRALLALNSVKGNELNSIAFYNEALHQKAKKQTEIENRMWDALKNHEFKMYLQPKYDLKTGEVHSAEALVRWIPQDEHLIYPDEFIPIFEQNGFITKLDMYMLEEACRYQALWKKKGYPLIPISVNQSRVFFYDIEYLGKFKEIIQKYQIDPSLIILEVTESVSSNNLEQIKQAIAKLHEMNFKISMDDFGSGYSSLNILKELPIDELKLDKAFIENTDNSVRSESILKNVIRLAKDLSISTVTEGIETKEQLDFLKAISCDIGQGYYFAKPMPAEKFEQLAFMQHTNIFRKNR